MEPHARYTLVGAVTIGLVALSAGGVFWLRVGSREPTQTYVIIFEKHSLQGLQPDGDVTMRGLPVGHIRKLHLSDNPEEVRVYVELKEDTPVKTDTRAVVERNLLTGLSTIDLIGSTEDAPRLTPELAQAKGGEGGIPEILEGDAQFRSIREELPKIVKQAKRLVERASKIVSDENVERVGNILESVESLASSFAGDDRGIGDLVKNTETLITDLRDLSRTAEKTLKKISGEPISELSSLLRELRELTTTIEASTRDLVVTQSNNLGRLSEDLRRAAAALSRTMESFERPRALLSGPAAGELGPGETP